MSDKNVKAAGRLQAENEKLRALVAQIASTCGHPDPAEACRLILKIIKEAKL